MFKRLLGWCLLVVVFCVINYLAFKDYTIGLYNFEWGNPPLTIIQPGDILISIYGVIGGSALALLIGWCFGYEIK